MKLAYYVHGRGRGHASRALSLIPYLMKAGHHIALYTSEDAIPLLSDFDPFIIRRDKSFPAFISRLISDYQLLKQDPPEIILSDGDAPSVYAARLLGIKSLSIGHGLIFPYCKHPFEIPAFQFTKESMKSVFNSLFAQSKIAVHFTPIKSNNRKTRVARPDFVDGESTHPDSYYVSYFRDHIGSEVVKKLTERGKIVHNFGYPLDLAGVHDHPIDRKSFLKYLSGSEGIIGTAGSNLIYEALMLKKPLMVIYRKNDFEQMINAKYVEAEHVGIGVSISEAKDQAIDRFLSLSVDPSICEKVREMPTLSEIVLAFIADPAGSSRFSN